MLCTTLKPVGAVDYYRAVFVWLLSRFRTFTGPSRHRHVVELLANGIDAQASCFLRVVQDATRAIKGAGVQFEEFACSQFFLHATVFIAIGGMHPRRLPVLFD